MSKELGAGGRFDIFLDSATAKLHTGLPVFIFIFYLGIYFCQNLGHF